MALLVAGFAAAMPVAAETLQDAWQRAENASRSLKAETLRAEAAARGIEAAEAAAGPQVSASAQWQKLDREVRAVMDTSALSAAMPAPVKALFPGRIETPLTNDHPFNAEVKVTLPVYTAGRLDRLAGAAREAERATRHGVERARQDLRLDVAEAYVNVLRANEAVSVATLYLSTLEAYRRDVGNYYRRGLVSRGDVSGADVSVAEARQRLIAAREARVVACAAFNRLTGRALDASVTLTMLDLPRETRRFPELAALALQRRPELSQLQSMQAALAEEARGVKAEAMPQMGVFASYTYLDNPYLARKGVGAVGVGVKWDVFDSGLVRARAGGVERRAAALSEQRDDAATLIQLDVQRGVSQEADAAERLNVARAALESAQTWQDITLDRYHNGLANQTEVLMAAAKKADSQKNLYNARFDHALAILRLKRAIGEL
ncbi:hypothetical protein GCM10011289_25390 [Paludibacterium paludis]|uniref:TolC family protein n=2 Tax=Paludibacterium paludis TaxID=1225769 RepID=A0A918P544_9NEIS|nr:hypothetical protein GCM10011289_25390 [Paludibacterium paludis]